MLSPKKIGRPTTNKKGQPIHVRLDEKSVEILDRYMTRYNVSRAEAIRKGIEKLENEIE